MTWTRWTAVLALTCCITGATIALAAAKPDKQRAERVKRGAYLVRIMGCNDCHTPGTFYGAPDMQRELAGSEMGWQVPDGVVFASNLTPDLANGLGEWTDDEIIRALRTGIRPDGRQLAPVMPWMNFSALLDADARAIVAYLRQLKPVAHAVPSRIPAGQEYKGPLLVFPPPSAWDAPRSPGGEH